MFKQKHTEETKKKISQAIRGKKHPRYGAAWTDEQRLKFGLTMYNKQREEQLLKLFLLQYNQEWDKFQQTIKL